MCDGRQRGVKAIYTIRTLYIPYNEFLYVDAYSLLVLSCPGELDVTNYTNAAGVVEP